MIAQRSHEPPVMITAFLELLLRVGHEVLRQPPVAGQVGRHFGQTADFGDEPMEARVRDVVLVPVSGVGRGLDEGVKLIALFRRRL